MNWLDCRLHKPNPNGYNRYTVIFKVDNSLFIGSAGYMPKNNYTDGDWIDCKTTTNNNLNGEVLYWTENPKLPEWLVV